MTILNLSNIRVGGGKQVAIGVVTAMGELGINCTVLCADDTLCDLISKNRNLKLIRISKRKIIGFIQKMIMLNLLDCS